VELAPGEHSGRALRRVQQEIVRYLSPWIDGGYGLKFDWAVRCEDVAAHLRGLSGVRSVSGLSLLHVHARLPSKPPAPGETPQLEHRLDDTARGQGEDAKEAHAVLPWSLAVPMREHIVSCVNAGDERPPEVTGVGHLAVGQTFIIGTSSA